MRVSISIVEYYSYVPTMQAHTQLQDEQFKGFLYVTLDDDDGSDGGNDDDVHNRSCDNSL